MYAYILQNNAWKLTINMYSFAMVFVSGRISPSSDGPYRIPAEIIASKKMYNYVITKSTIKSEFILEPLLHSTDIPRSTWIYMLMDC
jgi:hypothetical protein